jgi:hypothetical protein
MVIILLSILSVCKLGLALARFLPAYLVILSASILSISLPLALAITPPSITVDMASGTFGVQVHVSGSGFDQNSQIEIDLIESSSLVLADIPSDNSGNFATVITIPANAEAPFQATINAHETANPSMTASAPFNVLVPFLPLQVSISASSPSATVGTLETLSSTINDPNCLACTPSSFLYSWALVDPAGSSSVLSDPTAQNPTFTPDLPGSYQVSLVVTDTLGHSSSKTFLTISASSCGTCVPSVSPTVSSNQVFPGDKTTLDANPSGAGCPACIASFTFHWSVVSRPPGSSAVLSDPSIQKPTFIPDAIGSYEFGVIAIDSQGQGSQEGFVTLTVQPPHTLVPISFIFPDGNVLGQGDSSSVVASFNPKEYIVTKSVSWRHHDTPGSDAPNIEFTVGQPLSLSVELFFDTYEEKKSVKPLIDKIQSLISSEPESHHGPPCLFTWESSQFKCVLESLSVKYTLFLSDGTPARATANLQFKEFLPAQEQLNSYTLSGKDLAKLLDASKGSFRLLHDARTDSLSGVVNKLLEDLQPQQSNSILFTSNSVNPAPGPSSLFTLNVKISGNTNVQENSWSSTQGGLLQIEQIETTIGSDKFSEHSPGHVIFEDLHVEFNKGGEKTRDDTDNSNNHNCKECKQVTLSFYNNGNLLSQYTYSVIDAFYFKNEILLVQTHDDKLDLTILKIERQTSDGTQFNGPPRIFVVLPTSGPAFMPVGIGGTNFDQGGIPYFGTIPGGQLFNIGLKNLPLVGSISAGIAYYPGGLPSGNAAVTIQEFGQTSNSFPFTVN